MDWRKPRLPDDEVKRVVNGIMNGDEAAVGAIGKVIVYGGLLVLLMTVLLLALGWR